MAGATEKKAEKRSGEWQPTAAAESKASTLRLVAGILWFLAMVAEIGGIFGLLLNDSILESETTVADDGTVSAGEAFPNWAFFVLIGLLVVMGLLTIIGSHLWKKAQQLDPPSEANKISFFFKSQLGAIIPLIAFVPIIVFIFMNKNMSKQQKGWAGGVGIAVATLAVLLGINYDPPSVEEYTADQQAVIQLLGEDHVYWTPGGGVYHVCETVSDLANSDEILSGTTAEAVEAGKPRLNLKLESQLNSCGKPVPNNIDEIVDAIDAVRNGETVEQTLPQPDWTGVENPPSGAALDELEDVLADAEGS